MKISPASPFKTMRQWMVFNLVTPFEKRVQVALRTLEGKAFTSWLAGIEAFINDQGFTMFARFEPKPLLYWFNTYWVLAHNPTFATYYTYGDAMKKAQANADKINEKLEEFGDDD